MGEKTAARLINAHRDLDGVFSAVGDQTPKLRENLIENEAQARLNAELMALVRHVPLGIGIADLVPRPVDLERARGLLDLLELNAVRERLGEALGVDFGFGENISSKSISDLQISFKVWPNGQEAAEALTAMGDSPTPVAMLPGFHGEQGAVSYKHLTLPTKA